MSKIECLKGSIKNWVSKNDSKIWVGVGLVGFGVAVVTAVKATPIAMEAKKKLEEEVENPTKMDYVKTVAPKYATTAVLLLASGACVIKGNSIGEKKVAALIGSCKLLSDENKFLSNTLDDFKKHAKDELGEKKFKEVTKKVHKDSLDKSTPPSNITADHNMVLDGLPGGAELFYLPQTNQYFYSTIAKMRHIENEMNADLASSLDDTIRFSDLCYKLSLDPPTFAFNHGWTTSSAMRQNIIEFNLLPEMRTINGMEMSVIVVGFIEEPEVVDDREWSC